MKKLFTSILCAGLLLTGCSSGPKTQGITVTDQLGREVTLEKPAETVASGYYISTLTLIGLGQEEKIVGTEMKPEKRLIYKEAAPEMLENAAQLGNKKMFNVEECAKVDPDVVFLPTGLESYAEELETLEIPVIFVEPETQESFDEMLDIMATVMDCQDKVDEYREYADKLLDTYKVDKENDKTVYFAGSDILSAAGTEMFQNEIIEYAGAKNALDIKENKWVDIDVETLLAADPDYIFIENGSLTRDDFVKDARFQDLKAVKEGNVYVFPSALETWDTPGLSSVLGKICMAAALNPETIDMLDVIKEAENFYDTFYGFDAQEDLLGL